MDTPTSFVVESAFLLRNIRRLARKLTLTYRQKIAIMTSSRKQLMKTFGLLRQINSLARPLPLGKMARTLLRNDHRNPTLKARVCRRPIVRIRTSLAPRRL